MPIMKNTLCILISAIFAAALLAPPPLSRAGELNWMGHWKGEDTREQLVEEVKKEFEFLHPDIKVNLIYDLDLDAEGEYFKKKVANTIVEMIRTGEITYDVIFLGITVYNYVAEILDDPDWGPKHLLDFSTVPGFLERQKEFIISTPYYKNQTGGIFVGPFIEGLYTCLWYNKKTAYKAGIEVAERGMTTDQFLGYARQLAAYNKANGTKIPLLSFSSFYRPEVLFEFIFKTWFNNPESVVELTYSNEKAQAFLDTLLYFEELSKYQPILNEGWRDLPLFPWMKDYLAGNQGIFTAGGTYYYGHFKGKAPEYMANGIPVEPPIARYANGLVGQYSNVWAVMKNSPHTEAAVELLQLWSEPKIAEKWVDYTKNPTGLKGDLVKVDYKRGKDSNGDMYSGFVRDMSEKYHGMPMRYYRSPMYVFGEDCKISDSEFRESLALILEGKLSARRYFDEVMTMHTRTLHGN